MESFNPKQKLSKTNAVMSARPYLDDVNPAVSSGPKRRDGSGPQFSYARNRHQRSGKKVTEQGKKSDHCFPENSVVECEAEEDEVRAASGFQFKTRSKSKGLQNMTELLNFTYGPSNRTRGVMQANGGRRRGNSSTYSKEAFLQANCRFVVCKNKDYSAHVVDADRLVDWDWIEQVRMPGDDLPNCPICLYSPSVPRMTKCGHVYCWSCINHYFKLNGKAHAKCPICQDDIHPDALKSVLAEPKKSFAPGDKITMQLMKRQKGSTRVFPSTSHDDDPLNNGSSSHFSKLLFASKEDVLRTILQPEKVLLTNQLQEAVAEKCGEEPFIRAALLALEQQQARIEEQMRHSTFNENTQCAADSVRHQVKMIDQQQRTSPAIRAFPVEDNWQSTRMESDEDAIGRPGSESPSCPIPNDFSAPVSPTEPQTATKLDCGESKTLLPHPANDNQAKGNRCYFFYQASDGQNIFIHPINIRCLIKEYGGMEKCPAQINASIIAMETMTVTKESRKKYRSLGHLPLTCEFAICELMLKAPDLSKETLAAFASEFRQRKQQRQQKRREAKKNERKYEASSRMDCFGQPVKVSAKSMACLVTDSLTEFPLADSGSAPSSDSFSLSPATPIEPTNPSCFPVTSETIAMPPSFAQALGKSPGKFKPLPLPKLRPCAATVIDMEEGLSDDDAAAPSFADAFSMALAVTGPTPRQSADTCNSHANSKDMPGKNKKRKTKQVLFSTGNMRKY